MRINEAEHYDHITGNGQELVSAKILTQRQLTQSRNGIHHAMDKEGRLLEIFGEDRNGEISVTRFLKIPRPKPAHEAYTKASYRNLLLTNVDVASRMLNSEATGELEMEHHNEITARLTSDGIQSINNALANLRSAILNAQIILTKERVGTLRVVK